MSAAEITDVDLSHSVFALADLADVNSPDTQESPGATFLTRVQSSANEADADVLLEAIRDFVAQGGDAEEFDVNDLDTLRDSMSEWADSDVQIYTYPLWQEFVDLCLWTEDVQGTLGYPEDGDLTKIAMLAQYLVAERLLGVLLAERAQRLLEANPATNEVVESPHGFVYRASQENGDQVDCQGCGNPLDDDLPIVNDDEDYAFHEGCKD